MAQFVRHFLEDQGLLAPPGVSGKLGYPTKLVTQFARFLGNQAVSVGQTPGASKLRGGLGLDSANADANVGDCEQLFSLVGGAFGVGSGTGTGLSLAARASGTSTSWTGYFADLRTATATIALVKGVAGADSDLATAAFVFNPSLIYSVRFRVNGSGTVNLSLKIWLEGTAEPAAWTLTASDSSSPIAGPGATYSGLVTAASAAVGPAFNLWYYSIGTNGDAAPPRPKTWAEYLEFLGLQDTLRCVLVEMHLVGQDAAGVATSGRACVSNMPFVSRPSDPYPNICYEELIIQSPRIKRRMSNTLNGRATITYGDLVLANEVVDAAGSGRLDAWLSYNWDGRFLRTLYGHPTWRRVDFKTLFLGSTQDVYKAGFGRLGFKVRGLESVFKNALALATIGGSGPNASALIPFSTGSYFNAEPPLYDAALLYYSIPAFTNAQHPNHTVRVGGASLKNATRTISSVNTGTDTITADAAHLLTVGSTWVGSGSLPAPLVAGTKYYVKTVPNSTDFTLSATSGGATIDLTTTTAGGTFIGRLYDWSTAGNIILLVDPGNSRVTVQFPDLNEDVFGAVFKALSSALGSLAGSLAYNQNSLYAGPGPALAKLGCWWPSQITLGDAIDKLVSSVGASFCLSREGYWYLPAINAVSSSATPAWFIVDDDIRNWQTGERFLPSFVERLGYQLNDAIQRGADLVGSVSLTNRDLYGKPYSLANYVPSELGLEQPGNHVLTQTPPERPTQMMSQNEAGTEVQRIYNLWRKTSGTYIFSTDTRALAYELGDIMKITYQRDSFDAGRNVMIVGLTDDLDTGSSEVEVFSQIDGQWPVVSSTQPFIDGSYY